MAFTLFKQRYLWRDVQGLQTETVHYVRIEPAFTAHPDDSPLQAAERYFSPYTPADPENFFGGDLDPAHWPWFYMLERCSNARIVSGVGPASIDDRLPAFASLTGEPYRSVLDSLIVPVVTVTWPDAIASGVFDTVGLLIGVIPAPLAATIHAAARHKADGSRSVFPPFKAFLLLHLSGGGAEPSDRFGRTAASPLLAGRLRRGRALPRRVADRTLDASLSLPAL